MKNESNVILIMSVNCWGGGLGGGWGQARKQEFFGAGEVSWNMGTSINVPCTVYKRRSLQRKIWCFFSKMLLKLHFLFSKKKQGKPLPSPLPLPAGCVPERVGGVGGEWFLPFSFFENWKKVLRLCSSMNPILRKNIEEKIPKFFPEGPFFHVF